MKLFIRTVGLLAVIWLAMLFTGYGVLTGSTKNAAGLGLQCSYLTARGVISAQYLHTDSGVVGVTDCPLLSLCLLVKDNSALHLVPPVMMISACLAFLVGSIRDN